MKSIREQLHYARYGSMARFGGDSESANSTSSNSDSSTTTNNNTTNTTTNSSANWTNNTTDTVTQDRRLVNDHGIGVSADASTVTTTNSGNSSTSSTDSHNTTYTTTDMGAVTMGTQLAHASILSNQALAMKTTDIGALLAAEGMSMLKANIAFAEHTANSNATASQRAVDAVTNASNSALAQVASVVSKPLNANDPQHILVIVGLVVVGVVLFSKR